MKSSKLIKEAMRVAERHCVTNGEKFRLKDCHTAAASAGKNNTRAEKSLQESSAVVSQRQELLFAQDRWALLLIFQGMDAAGKDSAIKHVMSGGNPQGSDARSSRQPSPQELGRDFRWRTHSACPERGRIGIFNRSYYEEVVV